MLCFVCFGFILLISSSIYAQLILLIGVPQFVSFVCVRVCVCVCWEGRSGAEAPLLFYTTNIYSVLYSLAHLNNEPDITVSYFYREVPT